MDTDITSFNCYFLFFKKRKDAVGTSQTFSGPELNHHISVNSPLPNANTCVRFS